MRRRSDRDQLDRDIDRIFNLALFGAVVALVMMLVIGGLVIALLIGLL